MADRDKGFRIAGTVHDIACGYPVIPPAARETGLRDAVGRLAGVESSSALLTASYEFGYTYADDSDLVETLSESGAGLTVTRSYEPHRDLLTQVKNEIGTANRGGEDHGLFPGDAETCRSGRHTGGMDRQDRDRP